MFAAVLAKWTEFPDIRHSVILQATCETSRKRCTPSVPLKKGTIVHLVPDTVKHNMDSFRQARTGDPSTINTLPLPHKLLQQSLYTLRDAFPRDIILHYRDMLYMYPECKGMTLSECIESCIMLYATHESSAVQPVFFLAL